jgi:hypothetical protein
MTNTSLDGPISRKYARPFPLWRRSNKRLSLDKLGRRFLIVSLVFLLAACNRHAGTPLARVRAQTATGPLRANPANPRYFTDGSGKAIYLTGAHTWSNLLDRGTVSPPTVAFDYNAYINWMVSHNFNFMRLWTAELPNVGNTDGGDPYENFVDPPLKWVRAMRTTAH